MCLKIFYELCFSFVNVSLFSDNIFFYDKFGHMTLFLHIVECITWEIKSGKYVLIELLRIALIMTL